MHSNVNTQVNRTVATAGSTYTWPSQDLIVVNPQTPTPPFTVESAGQWSNIALVGFSESLVNSANQVTAANDRFLVYEKAGRLNRLDLRMSAPSAPSPTLLSTLSLSQVCKGMNNVAVKTVPDFSSPDRSVLVFRTPGPDLLCDTSDDAHAAVRLNMTGSDAPLPVSELVDAIRNVQGQTTGFLVRSGNQIRRIDADFANPVDLFTLGTPFFALASQLTSAGRFLFTYQDGNDVRVFDVTSGAGPYTLTTLAAGETVMPRGELLWYDNLYLMVNSASSGRLLLTVQGGPLSTLATDPLPIGSVVPTPTRVVYHVADPVLAQRARLMSVSKSGGAPITLYAATTQADDLFVLGAVAVVSGETLYVGNGYVRSASNRVLIVNSDGSNSQVLANTMIVGAAVPNPSPITYNDYQNFHSVMVAVSGTTLRAYEGGTRSVLFDYGTLPPGWTYQVAVPGTSSFLWGQPALINFAAGLASDAYFFRNDTPGLTRVTSFLP